MTILCELRVIQASSTSLQTSSFTDVSHHRDQQQQQLQQPNDDNLQTTPGQNSLLRLCEEAQYCDEYVCLSVCTHILVTRVRTSPNFLCVLPVAVRHPPPLAAL